LKQSSRIFAFTIAFAILLATLTLQTVAVQQYPPASITKRVLNKGAGWVRIFVTGVSNNLNEPLYVGRLNIYVDGSIVFSFVIDRVIPPKQTIYLGLNVTIQAPSGERRIEVRVYGSGLQIVGQDISIEYIPYPWEEWARWLMTPAPLMVAPIHGLIVLIIAVLAIVIVKRKTK